MTEGTASAPASSANLGPGFDCLGLALEIRCRVTVRPAADWEVLSNDENPGGPATAFVRAAAVSAGAGDPLRVEIASPIPRAAGLGSSAAVAAAVVAATLRSRDADVDRTRVYEIVSDLEGHGDNAAAAVWGGLVAVVAGGVLHLDLDPSLRPVVAVPDTPLATLSSRRVLPETVPHAAAARNAARAVALAQALRTGDRAAFAAAAGDELHEIYRAALSPPTAVLIAAARRAGALHAAWSGAGPSVLAIVAGDRVDVVGEALRVALDGAGRVLTPEVAVTGLE